MSFYTILDGTSLCKKNSKEVGYKGCDKGQQHKVCYQQDNERNEFLDHKKDLFVFVSLNSYTTAGLPVSAML